MKVLTFDVEEWFHLLDHPDVADPSTWSAFEPRIDRNLNRILELLDRADAKATFFCLGWVAEKYPHLVKSIVNLGHEVGCHSYYHRLAYLQTYEEFLADTLAAKRMLENVTGQAVDAYRVPGFSLIDSNQWVFSALIDAGFKYDCSVFNAPRAHGGMRSLEMVSPGIIRIPDGRTIRELPLNTAEIMGRRLVFSGGGYFRLAPELLLHHLFGDSEKYVMTYFHPRDFDPDQPVLPNLSSARRFKAYVGLSKSEQKLESLLGRYKFLHVSGAADNISWSSAPTFDVSW